MAITFGSSSAPSQKTINLDALFAQSIANHNKKLHDNIGAANAFFHEIMKGDLYESKDGGTHFEEPLMYGLSPMDWYDGGDELPSTPTDGVTSAIYQWRQAAVPITYTMREVIQNSGPGRLLNLVNTKIKQAEMGFQEGFSNALMLGAVPQGGALTTPASSTVNGSSGINPLPLLIKFDPTTSTSIGNISQSANTWWRNKTSTSGATTYQGFLLEFNHIFNAAALGTGGKPNLVLMDQTSYELFVHAFFLSSGQTKADMNYPFENTMYKGAKVVMDDKVPDVENGTASAATGGSAFFINTEFFKVYYESGRDFEMLKDDNGKSFQKPINGDSRLGHLAWMGEVCTNNRRKQAVMGSIARTLVP